MSLSILAVALGGCVSDQHLLDENANVATRTVTSQAGRDLGCDRLVTSITDRKEVPGTPLGELWSRYTIRAAGCGKQALYRIECTDARICSIRE